MVSFLVDLTLHSCKLLSTTGLKHLKMAILLTFFILTWLRHCKTLGYIMDDKLKLIFMTALFIITMKTNSILDIRSLNVASELYSQIVSLYFIIASYVAIARYGDTQPSQLYNYLFDDFRIFISTSNYICYPNLNHQLHPVLIIFKLAFIWINFDFKNFYQCRPSFNFATYIFHYVIQLASYWLNLIFIYNLWLC